MNAQIESATLTKAVLRVAERLELIEVLGEILGIDSAALDSLRRGERTLDKDSTEWEAATRFTGLFRSLITLVGTAENARAWLSTPHQTLGAAPTELLRTSDGRERVLRYLDAVQKFEIKLPPRGSIQ